MDYLDKFYRGVLGVAFAVGVFEISYNLGASRTHNNLIESRERLARDYYNLGLEIGIPTGFVLGQKYRDVFEGEGYGSSSKNESNKTILIRLKKERGESLKSKLDTLI
jgi:hypothetical protein